MTPIQVLLQKVKCFAASQNHGRRPNGSKVSQIFQKYTFLIIYNCTEEHIICFDCLTSYLFRLNRAYDESIRRRKSCFGKLSNVKYRFFSTLIISLF